MTLRRYMIEGFSCGVHVSIKMVLHSVRDFDFGRKGHPLHSSFARYGPGQVCTGGNTPHCIITYFTQRCALTACLHDYMRLPGDHCRDNGPYRSSAHPSV